VTDDDVKEDVSILPEQNKHGQNKNLSKRAISLQKRNKKLNPSK